MAKIAVMGPRELLLDVLAHIEHLGILQIDQESKPGQLKELETVLQSVALDRDSLGQRFLYENLLQKIEGLLAYLPPGVGREYYLDNASIAHFLSIEEKNVLGAKYRSAVLVEPIRRSPAERHYDFGPTTPPLEETFSLFEQVVEEMLEVAGHESKLKNLGEAIQKTSRKSRVLEERILPEMASRIHMVSQYIGEREREDYFRLKRFKDMRHRNKNAEGPTP